jgi:hypothetical protein
MMPDPIKAGFQIKIDELCRAECNRFGDPNERFMRSPPRS